MKSILTVIGTRPEAIKLAPVIRAIGQNKSLKNKVCNTKQHTDLLDPFLLELGIKVHYQLENVKNPNTLHQSASYMLEQFGNILTESKPDLVLVQGDTTTAFIASLAAFYSHIPVAHIEAGLRTGSLFSPWPEEAHRILIDKLTTYFFASTLQAQKALILEGAKADKIWVVGNTAIDAIRLIRKSSKPPLNRLQFIIVTVHRRENHGQKLQEICHALRIIAECFPDIQIMFFLHPNPEIRGPSIKMLSGLANIKLVDPIEHSAFIHLLGECIFVMTDSGGIQEEVSFIGTPTLILRDTTERPEGIVAGTARVVGTNATNIIAACQELLKNPVILAEMSKIHFPYGDGHAAERIVNILDSELKH